LADDHKAEREEQIAEDIIHFSVGLNG
jgi:hypothetical protein